MACSKRRNIMDLRHVQCTGLRQYIMGHHRQCTGLRQYIMRLHRQSTDLRPHQSTDPHQYIMRLLLHRRPHRGQCTGRLPRCIMHLRRHHHAQSTDLRQYIMRLHHRRVQCTGHPLRYTMHRRHRRHHAQSMDLRQYIVRLHRHHHHHRAQRTVHLPRSTMPHHLRPFLSTVRQRQFQYIRLQCTVLLHHLRHHHHPHHQYQYTVLRIPNQSSYCRCKTILLAFLELAQLQLLSAPLLMMAITTALVMVANAASTFQLNLFILSCPLPNSATISSFPFLLDSLKRKQIRPWIAQYQKYVLFC
uniref:Uncharacterized protein n=1 Tax=Anopheles funestus TaxID=62324 RepID=A0A182RM14_ANOFN